MNTSFPRCKSLVSFLALFFLLQTIAAQQIIELPHRIPEDIKWEGGEREYYSSIWDTEAVTNVSAPTMEVFLAPDSLNTGVAVVVAPGGGMYGLSIESEGNRVARWLNKKGVHAFVLRYRLVPTGEDGIAEISELWPRNPEKVYSSAKAVLPYAVEDGLAAITHIRNSAQKYGIDPMRIGFMGFSAGGAVTMGVGYSYDPVSRPDFLVPVYPWTTVFPVEAPPQDAPPILVVCASDDPLRLAKGSTEIYTKWQESGKSAALVMYAKGGHGFGMKQQGLPSDQWIQRFYDWAVAQQIVTAKH